jgi:integrase
MLNVTGKGGKERTTPLHREAVERLAAWLPVPGINDPAGPLFPAVRSPRGQGRDAFSAKPMTVWAVEELIGRYVAVLGLDPNVAVHSLRVADLTTAR